MQNKTLGLLIMLAIVGSIPEPRNISESPNDAAFYPDVEIAASGLGVVVWSDERTLGERRIYVARSSNGGITWSDPEMASTTGGESMFPDALFVGSLVFLAWADDIDTNGAAVYERELDEGTRLIPVPDTHSPKWAHPRIIAGSSDRLHAVFHAGEQEGNYAPDILYASRLLAETEWTTATIVYTHTTALGSWYPMLDAGHDDVLHLVWENRGDVGSQIMYASGVMSEDHVTWSAPITLSSGITTAILPSIASDSGGGLHAIWGEETGEENYVRYRRYDAVGELWEPSIRIDDVPVLINTAYPYYLHSSLSLFEDGESQVILAVAWHGFRSGGEMPAEDVWVSRSTDGGDTWSSPRNVSQSDTLSIFPSLTLDEQGKRQIVWQEHRGSGSTWEGYEIYYWCDWVNHTVYLPLVQKSDSR